MRNPIKIYNYGSNNEYRYESLAHPDPLDASNYFIPAFATVISPSLQEGYTSKWNGESWINEKIISKPIKTIDELKIEKLDYLTNLIERFQKIKIEVIQRAKTIDQLKDIDFDGLEYLI